MFLEEFKMATKIFDDEQVKQIRKDRKKGTTMRQLAKKYYCSYKTIQRILRRKGAYSQTRKRKQKKGLLAPPNAGSIVAHNGTKYKREGRG